jgi:hypothetical protein
MRERKTFVRKTDSESRRLSAVRNAVVAFWEVGLSLP